MFTVAAMCNLAYAHTDNINHFVYNAMDSPFYNFLPSFDKITDKIHNERVNGKTCYIHCHMGISRACTISVAYLMKYESMTFNIAIEFIFFM